MLLVCASLMACNKSAIIDETTFVAGADNKDITLTTLKNENGCIAQFTNYGGRWVSMWVPDKKGKLEDVILGFPSVKGYLQAREPYHGAITGRVCGRINQGVTTLGADTIRLANNDLFGKPLKNHLHGGVEGFHKKIWKTNVGVDSSASQYVEYNYLSVDGEEGYPGNLNVTVRYTLTNTNILRVEYYATTDKHTIVNLTNHVFFNLSGDPSKRVDSHQLTIKASSYVACDKELIPTGQILTVADTPLDFTQQMSIGARIDSEHPDVIKGKGYAVAYVLDGCNDASSKLKLAAKLQEQVSGRILEIYTNQPSLQLYNAWLMDGTDVGKLGIHYNESAGVALETQGMPDASNHPNFKAIDLQPGDTYYHITEHRFAIQ